MKFSFIYFFSLLIFSQSLSQDFNNKYINNDITVVEKKNLEGKKLYELGNAESSKDFFLTNLFRNRNYDEILMFYEGLPTDFQSPTIEKLVYKILLKPLNISDKSLISEKEDKTLFELRVNKLFEMGKFSDIDNFYTQLPINFIDDNLNLKRIEAFLLRNEFKNACNLVIKNNIKKTYELGKFEIICNIINQDFEKARFNLALLKELNLPGDSFFVDLAYKIMGDVEFSNDDFLENYIDDFSNLTPILLSSMQIAEISPTFENIKNASINNLIFILSSPTSSSEIKLYCAERLVKLKRIDPKMLAEVYQLTNFKNEEISNVLNIYKSFSPIMARSLLYQAIINESDPEVKFQLIKIFLNQSKKDDLFKNVSFLIKDSLDFNELSSLDEDDLKTIVEIFISISDFENAYRFLNKISKNDFFHIKSKSIYLLNSIQNKQKNSVERKITLNFNEDEIVSTPNKEFETLMVVSAIKQNLQLDYFKKKSDEIYVLNQRLRLWDLLNILREDKSADNFFYFKLLFQIVGKENIVDFENLELFVILKILESINDKSILNELITEILTNIR